MPRTSMDFLRGSDLPLSLNVQVARTARKMFLPVLTDMPVSQDSLDGLVKRPNPCLFLWSGGSTHSHLAPNDPLLSPDSNSSLTDEAEPITSHANVIILM